ncbi:hypothetical protein PSHT_16485 [Puccinia striiformis]|uniref:Uncharacterized protein n=1 Tax=Puccinia striiformis TaxID=27350 RepID=A0A2S4U9Q9_9BASI|nr:hypothetical protein PSHT_16485 [Puccinia striiformis]
MRCIYNLNSPVSELSIELKWLRLSRTSNKLGRMLKISILQVNLLLQRLIFAGRCSQFGLAIPLDDPPSDSSQDLDVPSPQGFKGAALFISFTQLVTWSRLGQTAQASVELFAIQSVSQLDPSLVEHFESASHETRNAIFVPHLDIRFGLTARPQSATLLAVKASAPSGITIDMSPSILLIIHAFLDVYERDSHLLVNLLESHTQSSDVDASRHERRLTVEPSISLSRYNN